jgi:hypothetical protein
MTSKTTDATMTEITMDTIITMVVRLRQPMTLKMENGDEYDLIWNREYRRPEVIKLGETNTDIRGIIQTIKWLRNQSEHTEWYPQTKRHIQPNG